MPTTTAAAPATWSRSTRRMNAEQLAARRYTRTGEGVNWRAVDLAKQRGGWRP